MISKILKEYEYINRKREEEEEEKRPMCCIHYYFNLKNESSILFCCSNKLILKIHNWLDNNTIEYFENKIFEGYINSFVYYYK